MTTKTQLKTITRAGQRSVPEPVEGNRIIHASRPVTIRHAAPVVITIPASTATEGRRSATEATLSAYLEHGRQFHPLCRHGFIERAELGYYHYERRVEWRTCALAAAYAGAFGARSVERPDFSYSMALWQLSQKLGYDLGTAVVPGPTGRVQAIADEMVALVDWDYWSRAGVAAWLRSLNL